MTVRVCVVGAGASGLTAAKNLIEHGLTVDVFERADDLGGLWDASNERSRLYDSVYTIASKPFSSFPDFPMPDGWPDYQHHTYLHDYLRRYAHHFAIHDRISFGAEVTTLAPHRGGEQLAPERITAGDRPEVWTVTIAARDGAGDGADAVTSAYDAVVIANGHNWDPKWPSYPGQDAYTGRVMHAADYREPSVLTGERVLVVGAGNTGCDIAVEAAQHAARCFHSTRRGYWYSPKYAFGKPADQVSDALFGLDLPTPVLQWLFESTVRLEQGDLSRHGLRKPDHRILETHPIVNSNLVYYVSHGAISPVDDVERFDGDRVVFTDGRTEQVDLVIFCTGYRIRFPFIDRAYLNWVGDPGHPLLYRNVFHPHLDDLFVCGLVQSDSGLFKLAHWQAVAIAKYLVAQRDAPEAARRFATRIRDHVADSSTAGIAYLDSTRHYVEVEHMDYIRALADDVDHLADGLDRARGQTDVTTTQREVVLRRLDWAFPAPPVEREVIQRGPSTETGHPPLLFVHGAHHAAWCWDEHWMPAAAERGWPCFAVSLRGHGESAIPPRPRLVPLRHYEHDVLQTIAELDEPPVLIGHSMGARVIQRVLARYPARAGVLVAPTPVTGSWRYLTSLARRHPLVALRGALGDWAEVEVPPELAFSRLDADEARRHFERFDPESLVATLEFNLPGRDLPSKAPVLVLGAGDDAYYSPVDVIRTARRYGTRARMFRGIGHDMMLDAGWEAPLATMLDWLERQVGAATADAT